jgi:hypothetical protein
MLGIPAEAPRVLSFQIAAGQLCYNVAGARTITIAPGFGSVPPTSACLPVSGARTTYTLSAANELGAVAASAAADGTPVQILTFRNEPSFARVSGDPVTLSWTTQGAERVNLSGPGAPAGPLPLAGSVVVRPDTNTSYTLFAYGPGGQVVNSALYLFVR